MKRTAQHSLVFTATLLAVISLVERDCPIYVSDFALSAAWGQGRGRALGRGNNDNENGNEEGNGSANGNSDKGGNEDGDDDTSMDDDSSDDDQKENKNGGSEDGDSQGGKGNGEHGNGNHADNDEQNDTVSSTGNGADDSIRGGTAGKANVRPNSLGESGVERGAERDLGEDASVLAGGIQLDQTEGLDDDGFLIRRGEIIAMSADDALKGRAAAMGMKVRERQPLTALNQAVYRLEVPAGASIDGVLARLRAQDPAGVFDYNHLYRNSLGSYANTPSTRDEVHARRALVHATPNIKIGLVDTGVNAAHPMLRGAALEQLRFATAPVSMQNMHGTAIASLLVSREIGLLPGARLLVADVYYTDKRGDALSEAEDLVRAVDWLMKERVPVINMSLCGPPNALLHAALARATQAGHLIVAAVGNAGPAAPPLYPSAYPNIVGVTAIDANRHVYRWANRGSQVVFSAPGVDVTAAAEQGITAYSGTSFASPYVAALAAMEHTRVDWNDAQSALGALRANVVDLGAPGKDPIFGFGLARPASSLSSSK